MNLFLGHNNHIKTGFLFQMIILNYLLLYTDMCHIRYAYLFKLQHEMSEQTVRRHWPTCSPIPPVLFLPNGGSYDEIVEQNISSVPETPENYCPNLISKITSRSVQKFIQRCRFLKRCIAKIVKKNKISFGGNTEKKSTFRLRYFGIKISKKYYKFFLDT